MDGLVKSGSQPFVLLAISFLRQLDHAVLRRAPCRLHIGLPSPHARKQIFRIFLRDEKLDADADLDYLANITKGYSGSDIQSLCVQAALASEADTTNPRKDGLRNLKTIHFEKAVQRSAPMMPKAALAEIREFAEEHDPTAWSK